MSLNDKLQEWSENKNLIQSLVMLAIILSLLSGYMWWTQIHQGTQNVFWGMMENSLATRSVTRESKSEGATASSQKTRVSFGERMQSHGLATVNQTDEGGETRVVTENIGTPEADFVRYISFKTGLKNEEGKDMDFESIEGKWAKIDTSDGQPTFLGDYAVGSIFGAMPFAHLGSEQRSRLISFAKEKNVFDTDFSKVTKEKAEDGGTVYVYAATVNPLDYINFLKLYMEATGLEKEGIDGVDFSGAAPVSVEYRIDPVSRQLLDFRYTDGNYKETYSGWGVTETTPIPDEYISEQELAKMWQNILSGQSE